jgi:sugar (pentulose or hexulose) kinase
MTMKAALFDGPGRMTVGEFELAPCKTVHEPNMDAHAAYARRFEVYKELHGALRPIHERLRA